MAFTMFTLVVCALVIGNDAVPQQETALPQQKMKTDSAIDHAGNDAPIDGNTETVERLMRRVPKKKDEIGTSISQLKSTVSLDTAHADKIDRKGSAKLFTRREAKAASSNSDPQSLIRHHKKHSHPQLQDSLHDASSTLVRVGASDGNTAAAPASAAPTAAGPHRVSEPESALLVPGKMHTAPLHIFDVLLLPRENSIAVLALGEIQNGPVPEALKQLSVHTLSASESDRALKCSPIDLSGVPDVNDIGSSYVLLCNATEFNLTALMQSSPQSHLSIRLAGDVVHVSTLTLSAAATKTVAIARHWAPAQHPAKQLQVSTVIPLFGRHPPYFEETMRYFEAVGLSHVYVGGFNMDLDGVRAASKKFQSRGFVSLIDLDTLKGDWDTSKFRTLAGHLGSENSKTVINDWALYHAKSWDDLLLVHDWDELFVPTNGMSMPSILESLLRNRPYAVNNSVGADQGQPMALAQRLNLKDLCSIMVCPVLVWGTDWPKNRGGLSRAEDFPLADGGGKSKSRNTSLNNIYTAATRVPMVEQVDVVPGSPSKLLASWSGRISDDTPPTPAQDKSSPEIAKDAVSIKMSSTTASSHQSDTLIKQASVKRTTMPYTNPTSLIEEASEYGEHFCEHGGYGRVYPKSIVVVQSSYKTTVHLPGACAANHFKRTVPNETAGSAFEPHYMQLPRSTGLVVEHAADMFCKQHRNFFHGDVLNTSALKQVWTTKI